jgi:hypothetical protein
VTGGTLRLAKKQLLSAHFRLGRLGRLQLPEDGQLGGWRKIEEFLELGHKVHLATPFEGIDPFLLGDHRIPIEIRGALFKFGEALDAL